MKRQKKKILVLDTGKEWGGGTVSLLELLKRLDPARYEVTALFYTNYSKGSGSDIRRELEAIDVEFIHLEIRKRFLAKAIKEVGRGALWALPSMRKKFITFYDYTERIEPAGKAIASILKEGQFDMLYMNNQPSSNMEGMLAAGIAGTLCIQHSRVEVELTRAEAAEVNRVVDRVICVSKGVMNSLIKAGVLAKRCCLVHNGIDPSVKAARPAQEVRDALGVKKDEFLIGTVGSLIKRKRVGILLETIALLRKKGIEVKGLIAGAGPEEEALKERAAGLGIAEQVTFTGFSADALSYIRAMDIFMLTSIKEGLPRVILEAMLMERPVVAARVTGPAELVINDVTGFLVEGAGAEDFARQVKRLLSSPELRTAMGQKGKRRVVKDFSIESYVEGVLTVFKEVFNS
ncbi:MAG: glycosyltransferase family 4 protein [Thermodesulfobacteriota bacterium]